MTSPARYFAVLALAFGAAELRAQSSRLVSAIDDELLLKSFATLASDSMQGRKMASPGSLKARTYIISQLQRLGVEPLVPGFVTEFPTRISEATPREYVSRGPTTILGRGAAPVAASTLRAVTGSNVLGIIRGTEHPDRYILVSAHYDHIGLYDGQFHLGANDNASGAAALLAIADLFVLAKPKNSVILAFFDGEEMGLVGANAFVRTPPVPLKQVAANINIDMISRSSDDILYLVGERYQPRMSALATTVSATDIVRILPGHDGRDSKEDLFRRSDHFIFHQRGIPAVLFTAEELKDYHLPSDIAAKANVGFYIRATSGIADFIRRMDVSVETFLPPRR